MKNTKKIIIIVGPTAIGKTALSISLAKALNTEIISCDSRQFYKELRIGAAPPNPKELKEIKHHFIQHLSVQQDYNVGIFELDVIQKIKQLHQQHNTLIVVGGSGLYVDAICKGFDKMPQIPTVLRNKLNQEFKNKGLSWLQEKVAKIDSEFYISCDKKNPQRLLRALEVFKTTGNKFSSYKTKTQKKRAFKIVKIGLNTNRELLYKRINQRVDIMMEEGLLEEVQELLPYQYKNSLKTVGYKEIFAFYNNEVTLERAVKNIKQNTRRFAKRQLTWFKKDQQTTWFEPEEIDEIKRFIGL